MPASIQEQILSAAAECSFGEPFLFEPDDYRKGNGVREPADLVWFCRDVMFMMNMKSGGRPYGDQVKGNLKQFRGWLRMWSKGIRLEGANRWRKFSIGISELGTLVLVSVVQGDDALVEIHHDIVSDPRNPAEEKVVLVASVPDEVLIELVRYGGSALDFVNLILRVAALGFPVDKATALDYMHEQRTSGIARALAGEGLLTDREEELDRRTEQGMVGGLRRLSHETMQEHADILLNGSVSIFNDLDWEATTDLVIRCADLIRTVRDVPVGGIGPQGLAAKLKLGRYLFLIAAVDARQLVDFGDLLIRQNKILEREHPEVQAVWIVYSLAGRPVVDFESALIFLPQLSPPSIIREKLLDSSIATALGGARR